MSAVQALPTGTVTFLFTDIEGSTLMVQELGDKWVDVLRTQRLVIRETIAANDGHEMGTEGDSFFVVFPSAIKATNAVVDAQRRLATQAWPDGFPVRVRMGLHTGEASIVEGGYVGLEVHRAARIAAAGHGGQILVSESTESLIEEQLPDGVVVRDLGEFRLKDLPHPERIFQLDVDGLPSEFPMLKSLNIRRNNLPLQLTGFVGREEELLELKGLLGHERLLTLVGPGGMGKTRLAIELAGDVLEQYAQGVWLVELAPIADPQLVAPTVLTVFGLREQPGVRPIDTLVDYLHSRQVLMVVDNCEHLIDASARLVDDLLQGCPGVKVVATSREGLGVAGETIWRVPSLSVPDPQLKPPFEETAGYAAVALFADRATAANPAFRLTGSTAPLVVQICRELDGIPLAIELAAARLNVLSVDQVAARLKDRFRLLTSGRRTALPRQQTLRAAIDWSYELLSESERVLLRRLSVFSGGFALDAVEEICGFDSLSPEDILDLQTALVAKSMVSLEEQAGEPRYRLLDTIWHYAAGRSAEAGEERQLKKRHCEWFLALAERAETALHGPEQVAWFDRLETEIENLRAGFECSMESGNSDTGLRFAVALGLFWRARGRFSEGRDWLERALQATKGSRTALRAKALCWAGQLTGYEGAYTQAMILEEESLAIFDELQDDWGRAFALQNLAAEQAAQDEPARAAELHQLSLSLFRQTDDKSSVGFALCNLGYGALYRGDFAAAIDQLEEALTIFREAQDKRQIGIALQIMGEVELAQGHYTPARALLEESLEIVREAKDRVDTAYTLRLLGVVARCQGDYGRALALLGESLQLARDFNVKEFAGEALSELGIAMRLQGDLQQAVAFLKEALPLFDPRERFGISRCLEALATVATLQHQPVVAATLLGAAGKLREDISTPLRPYELAEHEDNVERVRAALGTDTFQRQLDAGRELTVEDAIAFAFRETLDAQPEVHAQVSAAAH